MDAEIIDHATAVAALTKAREDYGVAQRAYEDTRDAVRTLIVATRPKGLLTVDEMAQAVGRDRNFIDSVWSDHGETTKGKQTRVPVTNETDPVAARRAYLGLEDAAVRHRRATDQRDTAMAERNRVVTLVYAMGIRGLGPSPIATYVGIDRNHVGRIARAAGIAPIHRPESRNQYTAAR